MQKSDTIGALGAALAAAQGEIEDAKKNAKNPHLRNCYADLGSVLDSVRPTFARHGLSVMQLVGTPADQTVSVQTLVMHSSGEWVAETMTAPLEQRKGLSDIQATGSLITYMRRYALMAVAGIAPEDDDGSAAPRRDRQEPRQPRRDPAAEYRDALSATGLRADDVAAYLVHKGRKPPSGDDLLKLADWLQGPGATKVREHLARQAVTPESVAAERKAESEEGRAERQAKHHRSWAGERAGFCAALRELGLTYDQLKAYQVAHGRPAPSALDSGSRETLALALQAGGADEIREWADIRAADGAA